MTNYIEELNENQREAVLYTDGPSLVIAGAGSGKTRVLTYKIAYLLEQGLEPWRILALTFTNKAAHEMQERVARQVGNERAQRLWMGTFHSIFARILRVEAERLGFSSRFTIYDQSDSRNLIKTIVKEMNLDEKVYKPAVIGHAISKAKNRLLLPADYMKSAAIQQIDRQAGLSQTGEIYRRYWQRCRQSDVMDFDDLLLYTYILFQDNPEVRKVYADRFQYVLVDEYQDTNYAQHVIVWQLTQDNPHLCVVGDDAQSIYSFRGAKIENILNFTKQYEGARIFKLEQNYRSTQTIVSAANSLIAHNRGQIRKEVFSKNEIGDPIEILDTYSDLEEASVVARKILYLVRRKQVPYHEIAVLYRTNAQSRVFEEAFRKNQLPYRIYGGLSFYQRKEIKDVIAYFRMVVNPHDEEAFKRIINYPARGIGQTTLERLLEASRQSSISLWQVLQDPEEAGLQVNKGTLTKLIRFREMMQRFMDQSAQNDAASLAMMILKETGIVQELNKDQSAEGVSRKENVEELCNAVQAFVEGCVEEGAADQAGLGNFLQEVSLMSDMDDDKEDSEDRILLMTVHAAKGLEFQAVFVVGLEENLFPSDMGGGAPFMLEEERRLFYVALTRAASYCFLSYARSRYRYGKTEFAQPSRFLREIDRQYLSSGSPMGARMDSDSAVMTVRERISQLKRVSSEPASDLLSGRQKSSCSNMPVQGHALSASSGNADARSSHEGDRSSVAVKGGDDLLTVGSIIEHERFGKGKVLRIEGEGENTKATVQFDFTGTKQLLLRFARFRVLK